MECDISYSRNEPLVEKHNKRSLKELQGDFRKIRPQILIVSRKK